MQVFEAISKFGFVALFISATIAGYAWRNNRQKFRFDELSKGWAAFTNKELYRLIDDVIGFDGDLTLIKEYRLKALLVLHDLEVIGRQSQATREEWERVLSLDDHARLIRFFEKCEELIKIVRYTKVPLDVRVWNGVRGHALHFTRRAFSRHRGPTIAINL